MNSTAYFVLGYFSALIGGVLVSLINHLTNKALYYRAMRRSVKYDIDNFG